MQELGLLVPIRNADGPVWAPWGSLGPAGELQMAERGRRMPSRGGQAEDLTPAAQEPCKAVLTILNVQQRN